MPSGSHIEKEIRARLERKLYLEAFEILLSGYQDKVFRLAYAMLGNRALAEETSQEIFLRIWKALGGYRGQASLSTWIFAVARNACLTAARANAAQRMQSIEGPGFRRQAPPMRARRGEPDLELLLSHLPERYRQVIMLFYMEERSYEEVARLLAIPLGTVKTYLHRARKELAAALGPARVAKGGR